MTSQLKVNNLFHCSISLKQQLSLHDLQGILNDVRHQTEMKQQNGINTCGKLAKFMLPDDTETDQVLYTAIIWSANLLYSPDGGYLCYFIFGIQALKQSRYKAGYLFEGFYFGAIMGSCENSKN